MDNQLASHLPSIELLMCQLGKSFDEACDELGLTPDERQTLEMLQASEPTSE